ncbi:TlpA family protein disulfide reductase [Bacillus suaedaesalsae]|uniref:Redoxin domain-containing protein n=1 Tax=Bacillus suaedaesalsae TaxID=2810349 RepID=A0ABS2DHK9_9BACI|nr:redoxin domain-containing protein [Bacillus suaedaesalsae]MBM6617943.1 redoxin domain-containing protein [Bacillus suaedaesalsae]
MLLKKIPNFTLTDLQGKPYSFEKLRGQNTLIFMWSSW